MKHERRALTLELRAKGRGVEGYAALFNTETRIGDAFTEVIAPGAFAASLASGRDVLALVDHDETRLLGRTRSGSLRLAEDSRGLHFGLDLPDTQNGRDVLALAERGDLGGMSFGFSVDAELRDGDARILQAVQLYEVSIISAFPAYPGTVVQARFQPNWRPVGQFAMNLAHAQHRLRILEAQVCAR